VAANSAAVAAVVAAAGEQMPELCMLLGDIEAVNQEVLWRFVVDLHTRNRESSIRNCLNRIYARAVA
jgi:hypothetical protein